MSNHFHLVLETPQPNLAIGMKWLLGTYTQRYNRRHQVWGHLFGGRYKAQLIDESSDSYLRMACDYVHLNPVRAGLVAKKQKLECFPWSSYPAYRRPKLRPSWLRTDRLLAEHGLEGESSATCREFERRMSAARLDPQASHISLMHHGWRIGADHFVDRLAQKLGRRGRRGERARERKLTDTARAEQIVSESLRGLRWRETDLAMRPKADAQKVKIARQLRSETPMTRAWIVKRLHMGSPSYLSALLKMTDAQSVNSKL
jgi:hypothetical protein